MSKLSQMKKNRNIELKRQTIAPVGMSMFDQIMQGYKEGSMHQKAQMIENESPFTTFNPSYQLDPYDKVRKQMNERMRGPKNSQIKRYLTPKDVELGPRSEKYENMRIDLPNDAFKKLVEENARALKEANELQLKALEEKFKSFQPVASNIPSDDLLKRAERAEAALKNAETVLNVNSYAAAQKARDRQIEANKIIKDTTAEINKYSTMADVAGITGEYRELIDSSNKRRAIKAQEEIEKLVI